MVAVSMVALAGFAEALDLGRPCCKIDYRTARMLAHWQRA
jgi:hypothetical protein